MKKKPKKKVVKKRLVVSELVIQLRRRVDGLESLIAKLGSEVYTNSQLLRGLEAQKSLLDKKTKSDFEKALDYCKEVTQQSLESVQYGPGGAPIFPEQAVKKPFDPTKPVSLDNRVDLNTHFGGRLATIAPQSQIDDVISNVSKELREKYGVREDRTADLSNVNDEDYTGTYKVKPTPADDIPPLDIGKIMGQK